MSEIGTHKWLPGSTVLMRSVANKGCHCSQKKTLSTRQSVRALLLLAAQRSAAQHEKRVNLSHCLSHHHQRIAQPCWVGLLAADLRYTRIIHEVAYVHTHILPWARAKRLDISTARADMHVP